MTRQFAALQLKRPLAGLDSADIGFLCYAIAHRSRFDDEDILLYSLETHAGRTAALIVPWTTNR